MRHFIHKTKWWIIVLLTSAALLIHTLFSSVAHQGVDANLQKLKNLKILPAFVEKTAIQRNVTEKDLHVSEVNVFPTSRDLKHRIKGKHKTLTIGCNYGRLGNEMSLYATLYGLARYNNRIPEGLPCYMNDLLSVFEISAGVSDEAPKNLKGYSITDVLREQDRHIPKEVTIIRGYRYPESYTFYHEFKEEIRKEFTFKPKFKQYAERMLLNLGANRSFNFYIGMHIRRGDYCRHLRANRGRMFDMKYLEQAMDYFRQRYHPALFVVASNDRKWCREAHRNFTNVIVSPEAPTPGHDLALLSHCNHTIMTYGTFGYWSGYLAGGETVYFDDFLSPDSPLIWKSPHVLSNYLPGWVGISTTPEGFWENYTLLECS